MRQTAAGQGLRGLTGVRKLVTFGRRQQEKVILSTTAVHKGGSGVKGILIKIDTLFDQGILY